MQRPRATVVYLWRVPRLGRGLFRAGRDLAAFCYLTMSALALVAVLVGVRKFHPRDPKPWLVLAGRSGCHSSSPTPSGTCTTGSIQMEPRIRPAQTVSTCLAIRCSRSGCSMFIRARQPRYRLTAAIDAILIGLAAVLVLWLVVIDGVIHDDTIPALERFVTIAYPIGDAMVLAAAVYLVLTGRAGRRSLYLLVASLGALLVGDVDRHGPWRRRSTYPAPSDVSG